MEGQHLFTETGGALGKHADAMPSAEFVDQALAGTLGGGARSTLEEQRADPFGQPANRGPIAHFVLGKKCRGCRGIDGEDIDPGNMVGHEQALSRWRARGLKVDAQYLEQLP